MSALTSDHTKSDKCGREVKGEEGGEVVWRDLGEMSWLSMSRHYMCASRSAGTQVTHTRKIYTHTLYESFVFNINGNFACHLLRASVSRITVNTSSQLLPASKYINKRRADIIRNQYVSPRLPWRPKLSDLLCHLWGWEATGPVEVTELRPHQRG